VCLCVGGGGWGGGGGGGGWGGGVWWVVCVSRCLFFFVVLFICVLVMFVCLRGVSVCECVCVCVAHTTILMYVLHLTFRCVISFFVGADITFSGIGKAQKHCNKEFFSCPGSVSHR